MQFGAFLPTYPDMPSAFAGSPDDVVEHLDGYQRAGLEHALLLFESEDVDDLLRQMQVFAERVAPRFADAGQQDDRSGPAC